MPGQRLCFPSCWPESPVYSPGLCYAEFASLIPIAGSAYTYGYATLGEIFAWIIGWDLILEYAFGRGHGGFWMERVSAELPAGLRHKDPASADGGPERDADLLPWALGAL